MGHTRRLPGGQAPDQASRSGQAGAGEPRRTSPVKGTKPVRRRVTPETTNRQPTTQDKPPLRSSQSAERGEVLVGELEARGGHVVLEVVDRAGARDREHL